MMKLVALRSALSNQNPFVPYSSPIVEYLMPLDKLRAVWQKIGIGHLKDLGQTLLPHHIDQKDSAGTETAKYVAQNMQIFVFVIKVTE